MELTSMKSELIHNRDKKIFHGHKMHNDSISENFNEKFNFLKKSYNFLLNLK
jgi:hypothetical protein